MPWPPVVLCMTESDDRRLALARYGPETKNSPCCLQMIAVIYIFYAFDQPLCLVEAARGLLFQRHR
jgi:hypothetical protein